MFYPLDALSCGRAVELAAYTKEVYFIRTSCLNTAALYKNDESLQAGKVKVVKSSPNDWSWYHFILNTAEELAKTVIHATIADPFPAKPLDRKLIIKEGQFCG